MSPIKQWKDQNGNIRRDSGKRITFRNGQYFTTDQKEIDFLEDYMRRYPDEIEKIGPKDVEMLNAVKKAINQIKDKSDFSDVDIIQSIKKKETEPIPVKAEDKKDIFNEKIEMVKQKRTRKRKNVSQEN